MLSRLEDDSKAWSIFGVNDSKAWLIFGVDELQLSRSVQTVVSTLNAPKASEILELVEQKAVKFLEFQKLAC